jgi:BirA family biotin operon repressor/biotin-[acetyl-CoA-carboxylase] ligase
MTIGRKVTIVTPHDEFKGIAMDVDNTGALVLKLEDGSIKKIVYGDCFHD